MAAAAAKKILLKSSDNEEFQVDEIIALQSETIKHMIEDGCANNIIPLPNVDGKTLAKVIDYCKKHVELTAAFAASSSSKPADDDDVPSSFKRPVVNEELKAFEADFMKIDMDTLYYVMLAANYLNVKSLLDLTTQTCANMIMGKKPEEIRETFNIKNDFTPEEEKKARDEYYWLFDEPPLYGEEAVKAEKEAKKAEREAKKAEEEAKRDQGESSQHQE